MSRFATTLHSLLDAVRGFAAEFARIAEASFPTHDEAEEALLDRRNHLSRYY